MAMSRFRAYREVSADSRSHHYLELDGLRGMAILMVVAFHYNLAPFMGGVGVDLFFVLSGFLLGGTLLDKKEAPNYFRAFYARRVCRIFPLYFLSLLLFLILLLAAPFTLGWLLFGDSIRFLLEDPLPLWSYFTFTQNFAMVHWGVWGTPWLGHAWSLAVVEQFYLILPFLIRFVSKEKLPYLLAGLILTAPLSRTVVFNFHPHGDFALYVLMPCRADSLLLGVLCAYAIRNERCLNLLRTHTKALYGVLMVLIAGVIVMVLSRPATPTLHQPFFAPSYGYTWLALMYSCVLLIAVTEKRGLVTWVTRIRPLGALAVITFGVYLLHMPIGFSFRWLILGQLQVPETWWSDLIVAFGALLITLTLTSISWIFFEKRIVRWGRSFRYGDATT
jgi:peptidoglycan/LPS O-acetylase OafA/YrhL